MSLRRVSLSVALIALGLLSACALRPHYKDMVQPEGAPQQATEGQTLMMRVVDPATGQPIRGAKVIAGAGRTRFAATSDDQGRVTMPVSQALIDENPLVEVVLPKGVKAYQFQVVHATDSLIPPAAPAATPAVDPGSTGSQAPASTTSPETPPVPPPAASPPGSGN